MIYFVICILCVGVLLWCLLYWWPRRHLWALAKKVPGPPCHPFIGNLVLLKGLELTEYLPTLKKLYDKYGSVVRIWIGPKVYFFIKDPDDIQQVLGNLKLRNRERNMMGLVSTCIGYNLITLRGDQWKKRRKLVSPSFHFKILETYVEVFGRKAKIIVEKLREFEGESFNVYNSLALCTLDAICETAIGTAVNSLARGSSTLANCIDEVQQSITKRVFKPWLWADFIYALTSDGRRVKEFNKVFHEFSEHVIAQKLDEFRRGIRSPSITTASNKKVLSFLDLLIEASEAENSILSPEEMRDEVLIMAAAGLETSATTMSFFLILVALHPEIQAEIHQELDKVFGADSRSATVEDLQQLPVMERCLKETLRLFPAVTILSRDIEEDLKIPSGYVLPADSCVTITSILTQRDGRNFQDPDKFMPDRWLPENAKKTHPFAYIPFSAGSRNCVGQKYAPLLIKSVLSQVLRFYSVTTPLSMQDLQTLEVSLSLSMASKTKNRYHVQLHER